MECEKTPEKNSDESVSEEHENTGSLKLADLARTPAEKALAEILRGES